MAYCEHSIRKNEHNYSKRRLALAFFVCDPTMRKSAWEKQIFRSHFVICDIFALVSCVKTFQTKRNKNQNWNELLAFLEKTEDHKNVPLEQMLDIYQVPGEKKKNQTPRHENFCLTIT